MPTAQPWQRRAGMASAGASSPSTGPLQAIPWAGLSYATGRGVPKKVMSWLSALCVMNSQTHWQTIGARTGEAGVFWARESLVTVLVQVLLIPMMNLLQHWWYLVGKIRISLKGKIETMEFSLSHCTTQKATKLLRCLCQGWEVPILSSHWLLLPPEHLSQPPKFSNRGSESVVETPREHDRVHERC